MKRSEGGAYGDRIIKSCTVIKASYLSLPFLKAGARYKPIKISVHDSSLDGWRRGYYSSSISITRSPPSPQLYAHTLLKWLYLVSCFLFLLFIQVQMFIKYIDSPSRLPSCKLLTQAQPLTPISCHIIAFTLTQSLLAWAILMTSPRLTDSPPRGQGIHESSCFIYVEWGKGARRATSVSREIFHFQKKKRGGGGGGGREKQEWERGLDWAMSLAVRLSYQALHTPHAPKESNPITHEKRQLLRRARLA